MSSKMFFIVKGKVLMFTRLPLAVLAELKVNVWIT